MSGSRIPTVDLDRVLQLVGQLLSPQSGATVVSTGSHENAVRSWRVASARRGHRAPEPRRSLFAAGVQRAACAVRAGACVRGNRSLPVGGHEVRKSVSEAVSTSRVLGRVLFPLKPPRSPRLDGKRVKLNFTLKKADADQLFRSFIY